MIQRPDPRKPITQAAPPRGRAGWAAFGTFVVLGGLVLGTLASQGIIGIPNLGKGIGITSLPNPFGNASPTTTSATITPVGTVPDQFTAYTDAQSRFALYVSSTWQHKATTLTVNGTSQAADQFTPIGSALPRLTIMISPTLILPEQFFATIGTIYDAQKGTNLTPTSGPSPQTQGNYQWSRIDGTVDLNGQTLQLSGFTRAFGAGSVTIIAESIPLNFDTTEKQDFTPMLASIALSQ